MQDIETTRTTLAGLKEVGVQVAIDDFGTGYSVLTTTQVPAGRHTSRSTRASCWTWGRTPAISAIVRAVIALAEAFETGAGRRGSGTRNRGVDPAAARLPSRAGFPTLPPLPADAMAELFAKKFVSVDFGPPSGAESALLQQFDAPNRLAERLTMAICTSTPRSSGWAATRHRRGWVRGTAPHLPNARTSRTPDGPSMAAPATGRPRRPTAASPFRRPRCHARGPARPARQPVPGPAGRRSGGSSRAAPHGSRCRSRCASGSCRRAHRCRSPRTATPRIGPPSPAVSSRRTGGDGGVLTLFRGDRRFGHRPGQRQVQVPRDARQRSEVVDHRLQIPQSVLIGQIGRRYRVGEDHTETEIGAQNRVGQRAGTAAPRRLRPRRHPSTSWTVVRHCRQPSSPPAWSSHLRTPNREYAS